MYVKRGFFLIELMMALCLIIFMVSIGVVQLSFLEGTQSHCELRKLMSACLYMQQRAIATNKELHLIVDIYNNEYRFDVYREKLPKNVRFGIVPGVKGPPGNPTGLIHNAVTFPQHRICFYPTGIISSGTVYLVCNNKLCALSNAVSQLSYMRIYYYDGGWKSCDENKK